MCPRAEQKKGWEADASAWCNRVTVRSDCPWCFFFFLFFPQRMMISITFGPVNLLPLWSLCYTLRLCLPYSLIAHRRWNGVCDWWSCACCIRTVARYVDIPLTYRLHCVELKRCERLVICCFNKSVSSCAKLLLSKIVVLKSFLALSAIIFAADAILLRKSLRHDVLFQIKVANIYFYF